MKILLSFFFMLMLTLKMGGYFAYLSFEREMVRAEVAQQLLSSIDRSALVCIVANAQNIPKINWGEDQKEFSFEGRFYDIASTEIHQGLCYYYCFDDQAETQLAQKIDQFLANQWGHPSRGAAKLLFQAFADPFVVHYNTTFGFEYHFAYSQILLSNITLPISKGWFAKLKRPPQI